MRKVLSWRILNTMHASFRFEDLKEVVANYGPPENMNSDQGSRLTAAAWITMLISGG